MELGAAATSKPPQISEMFQKFAIAFKAKTFELFAEEEESAANSAAVSAAVSDNEDGFTLLDSTEDFITDQKVIIIKPDLKSQNQIVSASIIQPFNTRFGNYLISSVFAVISSFEASYLQLQTSHVPFDEEGIMINDKALVNQLQKLYDLRGLYIDSRKNPDFNLDFTTRSCLEAQVNENQNKLRALETMFNRLQSDIDGKDDKVLMLKKQLGETEDCNSKLSMKLSKNLKPPNGFLPTIRVFDSMLRDACRSSHRFTKLLIQLMKKAGWDLGLAANYVHPDVGYVKKGHNRYAFLSYVSLGMFQGFDSENFGLAENVASNDNSMELFEHVLVNPLETLNKNPSCAFSKFCERKYEELVHPTMESSIFKNLDRKKEVLDSWRSLSVFYEAFVNMSSSMWLLHKLARSFHPTVEIFQVEKGVDFSMVYMEDVTKKDAYHDKGISEVGFTVVPGFKIGKTVIQSQVYLTGSNRTK
ncbi:protein GRAVITROPIC IN THE LIGHT 1 [Cynara cardunculus var. scolymus]|uniref:protein GRAVITROPIC IN THE LIGHT 1 n=1 Tax=Cynara cardunculus var. scolymus TaxID=59895 RepID=UPI000D6267AD|nr:protein GRAVITROPIC IN THE LIGHT 1 [Cynara cardunculus var. scolymus]